MIRMEKGRLAVYDQARLDDERGAYQKWMDDQAEEVYQLAERAKSQGLDFEDFVEIPRTRDLASRTEKLLEEYLDGMRIEDDLRNLLKTSDRETAAIEIA